MINLRSNTLDALAKVELGSGVSRVDITVMSGNVNTIDASKDRDMSYHAFNLPNGINVFISPDAHADTLEIVDAQGVVHDASKWFIFNNYFKLMEIMSEAKAHNVGRDIDFALFDVTKTIFDQLVQSRVDFAKSLHSDEPGYYDVVYNDFNYGLYNASFYERSNRSRADFNYILSKENHYISNSDLSNAFEFSTDYASALQSALSGSSNSYKLSWLVESSLVNIGLSNTGYAFVKSLYSTREVLDERLDYIIYDVPSRRGSYADTYNIGIPLSFLDDRSIEYGFCAYSNQVVLSNRGSSSSNRVAYNGFGERLPRMDGMFLSSIIFDNYIEDAMCDECGDSHTTIDGSFVDGVVNSMPTQEMMQQCRISFESNYSVVDNYDYLCEYCERRHQRAQESLSAIGIKYNDTKFTLTDGNTYYLHNGSGIDSYDYSPDFDLRHLADESDSDLHLGVEIEIDKGGEDNFKSKIITSILNSRDSQFSYSMHDGSLSDGFEIATMPSTLLFHMNNVDYENAFSVATLLNYRAHDTSSCGLHVHMNRRFFGSARATQNIKASYMALILERNWDEVIKFSRRNYHSIEEWADKKDFSDNIYDSDDDSEIAEKFLRSYDDKYVALNTQHRNSFELRIFRGTLRYETYIATLQFVSNLANISKDCTTLTRAQQITFNDIINYKRYTELDNYLKTRSLFVESDTTPILNTTPTLFSVAA